MARRAIVPLTVASVAAACDATENYVYSGRRFDADAGCLQPYRSIDLVIGDQVSSKCAPVCFRYGGDTFTSKMCPPLPALATELDAAAPECVTANSLYETTCGADAAANDDGGDPDAGADALDAGNDGG